MTKKTTSLPLADHRHPQPRSNHHRPPPAALDAIASTLRCRAGQEICGEQRGADAWYYVVCGAARTCSVRPDGRRQIVDLMLPGDFFGFGARAAEAFTVEAVAPDTVLTCYPRRQVEALAARDPRVLSEICERAQEAMLRLQDHLLVLGRVTARGKVASFLLAMEQHLAERAPNRLVLPMPRYDIADYLGISVETVSRSLTGLRERGAIAFAGTRRVSIVNRKALREGEIDLADVDPPPAVRRPGLAGSLAAVASRR